jgi:hypothetical protein
MSIGASTVHKALSQREIETVQTTPLSPAGTAMRCGANRPYDAARASYTDARACVGSVLDSSAKT